MVEKVVISLDPEKKVVKMYPSSVEAARSEGVSKQAVAYAVKTGGSCAGKKWKRSPALYVVRAGKALAVCQKEGNAYIDLGIARVFKGKDVDKVVNVTVTMWEATL